MIELLGYLAALLTTFAAVPQLIKIMKTKHTKDLSLLMFSMSFLGILLWLVYGVLIGSSPIIIANIVSVFIVGAIILYKLKYR